MLAGHLRGMFTHMVCTVAKNLHIVPGFSATRFRFFNLIKKKNSANPIGTSKKTMGANVFSVLFLLGVWKQIFLAAFKSCSKSQIKTGFGELSAYMPHFKLGFFKALFR